ncbi:MAG: hypothetical protein RDU25_00225 [Patescibacteria group bacterium]|jgi:hypothetical protein|nr:hypothetical protein [Patescibacteria group bacterium]
MKIRVYPTGLGTRDWRVEFADGRQICDIRLAVSSIMNGSRYYIIVDGTVTKEGTFDFAVWDWDAARELLTALVRSMYLDAEISVEIPQTSRAVNG